MTTVGNALQEATARLRPLSPSPRLDAEILLAYVLGMPRSRLIASLPDLLDAAAQTDFTKLVARRADLEPVAYLTGEREFYGLRLFVDRRVLVPRPETEILVDLALAAAKRLPSDRPLQIADIGTGSGAIAIAVASNVPRAHIWAVDLAPSALEVAAANVRRYQLDDRVTLLQGDRLAPLPGQVDLLLSNPPYTVLDSIDENVRRYEPHLALDGGPDGLQIIREIIGQAPHYLRRGTLLIEIEAQQSREVADLAAAVFPGAVVTIHRDLAGLDRILEVKCRP